MVRTLPKHASVCRALSAINQQTSSVGPTPRSMPGLFRQTSSVGPETLASERYQYRLKSGLPRRRGGVNSSILLSRGEPRIESENRTALPSRLVRGGDLG